MPNLAVVAFAAASQWRQYSHRNAYSGNGAGLDVGTRGEFSTVEGCQEFCIKDIRCECVVYAASIGRCWKRKGCDPKHFVHDKAFDIYLNEAWDPNGTTTRSVVTTTRSAASTVTVASTITRTGTTTSKRCPFGTLCAEGRTTAALETSTTASPCGDVDPDSRVTVGMVCSNIDYSLLHASPTLENNFRQAVATVVAGEAGDDVLPDCVDVELSPGSVGVQARLSPPAGVSPETLGRKLAASSVDKAVGTAVSDVVDSSGVSTGPVSVGGLSVTPGGPSASKEVGVAGLTSDSKEEKHTGASLWVGLVMLSLALLAFIAFAVVLLMKRPGPSERQLVPVRSDDEESPQSGSRKGLRVHFVDQTSNERVFVFKSAPVGMVMSKSEPNRVQGFNVGSYAKEKGVQTGWQVTQVGGTSLPIPCQPGEVDRLLRENSQGMNVWPHDSPRGNVRGLRVYFHDEDGDQRIFNFKSWPLGIIFSTSTPNKVDDFVVGSYAKEKGVRPGWQVMQVSATTVSSSSRMGDVERLLEENSAGLEIWPFRVDFETDGKEQKIIYFKEGPLGMEFANTLPIIIDEIKPGSVSQDMGVRLGWKITRVGDKDVRGPEMSFEQVVRYIVEGVGHLPVKR